MKLFSAIVKEFGAYERRREQVIKESRVILREAKSIIFLCHEGKQQEANDRLQKLSKLVRTTEAELQKPLVPRQGAFPLYSEGSWSAGAEEYLEAYFFTTFLKTKKLGAVPAQIHPKAEVLLGALADFTGEVLRAAVLSGADKDVRTIQRYRSIIAEVVAFMLPLYLTGQSRQKFDQAKKNLKRIEEILYEVKIRI